MKQSFVFQKFFALSLIACIAFSDPARAADEREPSAEAETQLSKSDARILKNGEIGVGRWVGGAVLGGVVGFGTGHALQHRYRWKGMVDTIGEGASAFIILLGAALHTSGNPQYDPSASSNSIENTESRGLIAIGATSLAIFRLLSIIDLAVAPKFYNDRYRELIKDNPGEADHHLTIAPTLLRERLPGLAVGWNF